MPYFLEDNKKYWDKDFVREVVSATPTPLEIAEQRHASRTPEQVEEIKQRFTDRHFSKEQIMHFHILSKALGKDRGIPMTVDEADKQSANPNYHKSNEYKINCQTCVQAFTLRLMGYDVTAKGNIAGSKQEYLSKQNSNKCWKNADGTGVETILYSDWLKSNGYKQMSSKRYLDFYNEHTKDVGIYIVTIGWKGGGGHATILQRKSSGELVRIEPQCYNGNIERDVLELCKKGEQIVKCRRGIFRADDKIFDETYCSIFE